MVTYNFLVSIVMVKSIKKTLLNKREVIKPPLLINSFIIDLLHHVLAITAIASVDKCFKHFSPRYINTTTLTFINSMIFY